MRRLIEKAISCHEASPPASKVAIARTAASISIELEPPTGRPRLRYFRCAPIAGAQAAPSGWHRYRRARCRFQGTGAGRVHLRRPVPSLRGFFIPYILTSRRRAIAFSPSLPRASSRSTTRHSSAAIFAAARAIFASAGRAGNTPRYRPGELATTGRRGSHFGRPTFRHFRAGFRRTALPSRAYRPISPY